MYNPKYLIPAILIIAFAVLVYFSEEAIMPFIVGYVLAYFSKPLYLFIHKRGLGSSIAALVTITVVLLLMGAFFATLLPVLVSQVTALTAIISVNKPQLLHAVEPYIIMIEQHLPELGEQLQESVANFSSTVFSFIKGVFTNLLSSSIAAAHFLSLVFVTPFAYFYFLRDWDSCVKAIYMVIPKKFHQKLVSLFDSLDHTMSSYIRGQFGVCVMLSVFYSLGLLLIGVNYSVAVGFLSGFLTIVPYLGVLFAAVFALLITAIQFASGEQVLMVLLLYGLGQFFEGNLLVPRIMGNSLNVHPLWIIFALLAGGSIFGFIGVLIALPLTAAIGVVIRFLLNEYSKV